MTLQIRSKKETDNEVKVTIPPELNFRILERQVLDKCSFKEAALKVAQQADPIKLKKLVDAEVNRRINGEVFARLNKIRGGIIAAAKKEVRENEDNFRVLCPRCRTPMHFSNRDSNWSTKIQPTLKNAFGTWSHTTCRG